MCAYNTRARVQTAKHCRQAGFVYHCLQVPDHGSPAWPSLPSLLQRHKTSRLQRARKPRRAGTGRSVEAVWQAAVCQRYVLAALALRGSPGPHVAQRTELASSVQLLRALYPMPRAYLMSYLLQLHEAALVTLVIARSQQELCIGRQAATPWSAEPRCVGASWGLVVE